MNNYFCVLPFYSFEFNQQHNRNIHCCRLKPNTDIADVQKSIQNRQRSPACEACWKLEDLGLESERQIHNRSLDYYANTDLEILEKRAVENGYTTKILKLPTSNLCNGTCVTCNATHSSAWAALENKPINYHKISQESLNLINLDTISQLSFVGGEPFLEKNNFDILEQLIALDNVDCFISIVTNGSVTLTAKQLRILDKFKNLNVCVSIDGTGPVFEYLRYPLKWDQLLQNLAIFKSTVKHVSVSSTISNLNIMYYSDLIDFFKSENLLYHCKPVMLPSVFRPSNVSLLFKDHILKHTRHANEIQSFIQGDFNETQWKLLKSEIARQDQLKNISISDYLPEVFHYINL